MKFQLFSISLLVTLLFLSLTSNAATLNSVKDTDGHALIPGNQYYILPVIRGHGGGLTMTQHNDQCPLYVAQENMEVEKGLPLIFHPANPKDKVVCLSTDINIEFEAMTICVMSLTWQLGNVEGGKRYVITGGINGNPGKETVSNWFKIEKWGSEDYKLVFCPSVCETCKVVCGDVGVFYEDEKRLLGLSGEPFPVMFKKIDS
ncbi:miraculin-like protein [Carex littledalei]|uniref:Miraculin-like protein n=1 Tax=Carex littledalei TaxID=544730 RepID=A0A833RT48_9POAL|nr:miraculin-like protein [Carex littledalei]